MIRRPPRSTRTDTPLSLHDALPIFLADPFGDARSLGLQFAALVIIIESGAVGVGQRDGDARILRLQPEPGARDRAAGARSAGEAVDATLHLGPDFFGRAMHMRLAIGDIVELVGPDRIVGFLGNAA